MKLPGQLNRLFQAPRLTRPRIVLALATAVFADGLQLLLGFFGWIGADQVIDVVTMVLTSWMIGFHWLLLPTFVVEFIPLIDALPCASANNPFPRRRRRNFSPPTTPSPRLNGERVARPP